MDKLILENYYELQHMRFYSGSKSLSNQNDYKSLPKIYIGDTVFTPEAMRDIQTMLIELVDSEKERHKHEKIYMFQDGENAILDSIKGYFIEELELEIDESKMDMYMKNYIQKLESGYHSDNSMIDNVYCKENVLCRIYICIKRGDGLDGMIYYNNNLYDVQEGSYIITYPSENWYNFLDVNKDNTIWLTYGFYIPIEQYLEMKDNDNISLLQTMITAKDRFTLQHMYKEFQLLSKIQYHVLLPKKIESIECIEYNIPLLNDVLYSIYIQCLQDSQMSIMHQYHCSEITEIPFEYFDKEPFLKYIKFMYEFIGKKKEVCDMNSKQIDLLNISLIICAYGSFYLNNELNTGININDNRNPYLKVYDCYIPIINSQSKNNSYENIYIYDGKNNGISEFSHNYIYLTSNTFGISLNKNISSEPILLLKTTFYIK